MAVLFGVFLNSFQQLFIFTFETRHGDDDSFDSIERKTISSYIKEDTNTQTSFSLNLGNIKIIKNFKKENIIVYSQNI